MRRNEEKGTGNEDFSLLVPRSWFLVPFLPEK